MDLTFQVPVQYCSLQHQILLSPPDTSMTEHHFHFGLATLFFLELLVIALFSSTVAYWTPSNLGVHLPMSYVFAFSSCSWSSQDRNTRVVYLHQWTTFCQNSSLWPIHLGWPSTGGMAHSFTEFHKPLHHDKAVIHKGDSLVYLLYSMNMFIQNIEWHFCQH